MAASFWAWREHCFQEHYMVHMPVALHGEGEGSGEGGYILF